MNGNQSHGAGELKRAKWVRWTRQFSPLPIQRSELQIFRKGQEYDVVIAVGLVAKQSEFDLRFQNAQEQLGFFHRVNRFLARDHEVSVMLQGIVSIVADFMQAESCLAYLLKADELVLCASNYPHCWAVGEIRLRMNEGITGWVARERRMVAIPRDAFNSPRFKLFSKLAEDCFAAFLSAPVISRNRLIGVINVQHRSPHQHTGAEMEALLTVCGQVGCAVVVAGVEGDTRGALVLAGYSRLYPVDQSS